jgi:ferrochelatase
MADFDSVLIVGFGGPERPEDVLPFLENVTRGKGIPRQRLLEVAEHYYHFGGRSPIQAQTEELARALERELGERGPRLPVYIGNRNWHPYLAATLGAMKDAGLRRAAAFVTSAFSSYSGCRQYLDNIEEARRFAGPDAPDVVKLGKFHNHPGFLGALAERLRAVLGDPAGQVLFTAHSIPDSMAHNCEYVAQLTEVCHWLAAACELSNWKLVYQSRSGPPSQPWLGPDINDAIREAAARGAKRVVVDPIGFLSDHLEVLWDLDNEASETARSVGVELQRAPTVGTHPLFIAAIRDLIASAIRDGVEPCPPACCPAPRRAVL